MDGGNFNELTESIKEAGRIRRATKSNPDLRTERQCKCKCGLHFTSVHAFDKHRTGTYQPNERRCMTTEEMLEAGMVLNRHGYWVSAKNPRFEEVE